MTQKLLEISPAQVARETARSLQAIADNRRDRRQIFLLVVFAAATWGLGLFLLGLAGHVTNVDAGAMLFWSGLAIGNAGPMYAGLWYGSHHAA